jgi:hypothetical protein
VVAINTIPIPAFPLKGKEKSSRFVRACVQATFVAMQHRARYDGLCILPMSATL